MNYNKELEIKIELVKAAIKEAGGKITQEEIAERLGKNRTYLSRLKKGKKQGIAVKLSPAKPSVR